MYKIFNLLLLIIACFTIQAQEETVKMRVERGDAVDKQKPVWNVFVDAENQKWVGNSDGLYQVYSINNGVKVSLRGDEWALLQYRSGNANLRVNKSEMQRFIPSINQINCASLNVDKQILWVGTTESGLYEFSLAPLKLIKHHTADNSELESDFINFIEIEPSGRMWVGTPEGIVWGKPGRWNLDEKYLGFVGVAYNAEKAYVVSEEWIWEVSRNNKWKEMEVNPQQVKGLMIDAELDSKGRLWLASEIISRFDPETGTIEPFAAPEYYTSEFAAKIMVDRDDALWVGTRDKGLFIIEKENAITVSVILENPISCGAFEYDGELMVDVIGGMQPYTYEWSNPTAKGKKPKNLGPGEYTVTVTDNKGKTKTASGTINDPAVIVTVKQDAPESGVGAGDAQATISIEGGVPDYKIAWDNGETTETAKKLTGGTHNVTVTDEAGCSNTATIEVGQNIADLAITISEAAAINCSDAENGSLTVEVSGGKPPYQFAWNNPKAKGEQPNNLAAGDYILSVSDDSGKKSTAQFTLKAPAILTATVNMEAPASTGEKDGKATAKVNGGTAPYTYSWDTGETGKQAKTLGAGDHEVTIKDGNGCMVTAGFKVDENILPLVASIEQKGDLKCNENKTAELLVKVNGGKVPFIYEWNQPGLQGENPKGLGTGNYEVTITDASGKIQTANIEVKAPEPLTLTALVTRAATTGNEDGEAKLKANGGSGKYTYQWDNGETDEKAKKLAPGKHIATVTDKNGCTITTEIMVNEDILPLNASIDITNELKCSDGKSGGVNVKVNGGKTPYTFAWQGTDASGEIAENLAAGKYAVVVSDAEGTTTTADFTISAPDVLQATVKVEKPASTGNSDGKASVKVKGGKGQYIFKWDNNEKGETASKLAPGKHEVLVTDVNGCTTTAEVDISENILPLAVTVETTSELKCAGDNTAELSASVNGGKPPYTFTWKGTSASNETAKNLAAGKYIVVVTDAAGTTASKDATISTPDALQATAKVEQPASTGNADGKASLKVEGGKGKYTFKWDNNETGETASKLAPGTHEVIVTDANGCTTTVAVVIQENILPLTVNVETKAGIKCNGASTAELLVTVDGGKPPFKYAWTGTNATNENPKGLAAGNYEVIITDAEGGSAKSIITLEEPKALSIALAQDTPANTGKADGKVSAKVTGGKSPYTYEWDNQETGETATKLAVGQHTLTVKDKNGCSTTETISVSEDIQPLVADLKITNPVNCHGDNNGGLEVTLKGGKTPFTYQWNTGQSTASINNLAAGSYEVKIKDATGLEQTASVELTQPEPLGIELKKTPASSEVSSDGTANAVGVGGNGTYNFSWSTGPSGPEADGMAAGNYSVRVKDEKGCVTDLDFEIKNKQIPELTANRIQNGQTIKLEKLYFDADSSSITNASIPTLEELFEFLTENGSVAIEIGGHTNNIPSHDFCDKLSAERAKAVADYLTAKGINPRRVLHKGYGKRKPKFTNKTKDGREKNQRVEVKVLSI